MVTAYAPEGPLALLFANAIADIRQHIYIMGDSLVQGGSFSFFGEDNMVLRIHDTNNHQTTYGVLGAAVMALWNFMTTQNQFRAGNFQVYDGPNMVGQGFVGREG